jgi:hypothetical protein
MADCACTNFPANLGIVTIGASTMTLGSNAKIDVKSGATTSPMAIMFGRTSEDGRVRRSPVQARIRGSAARQG